MFYQFLNFLLSVTLLIIPILSLFLIVREFKKELLESKFYFLILLFLNVVFLNKLLFYGQSLAAQDFNNIQITFNYFFQNSYRNYQTAPIWLNNFGGGFDAFSNPISNYFSPFSLLLLLIPNVYTATNYIILFTLIFISFSSFIFFKELKFTKEISFFGSILFTFNSFVVMRLSPGVGVEYLYTFKWLPLLLIFANRFFILKEKRNLYLFSLVLGFSFEGNINMTFGIWLLLFFYLLVSLKINIINYWKDFIKIFSMAIGIYAIKLLPGFDLMLSSSGRISNTVSGWRTSRIKLYEFLEYFFPISHKFQIPNFTTGTIAIIFFILCLIFLIYTNFFSKNYKTNNWVTFSIFSLLFGAFINTDNPASEFLLNLPIFNRITASPSFIIFLLFPVIFLPAYLLSQLNLKRFKFLPLIFGLLVFIEVLLGPSFFKNKSYTFNFDKINPQEVYETPHYKFFENNPNSFYFYENSSTFIYPYSLQFMNVYNLNKFKYFYSNSNLDSIESDLNSQLKISKYIQSWNELSVPGVKLITTVDLTNYPKNVTSYAIKDKWSDMSGLVMFRKWNQRIYIYENLSYPKNNLIVNESKHPWNFRASAEIIETEKISSTISYSKWWIISDGKNNINYLKNDLGLIEFPKSKGNTFNFIFANPFIYLGMFISIFTFIFLFKKHMYNLYNAK